MFGSVILNFSTTTIVYNIYIAAATSSTFNYRIKASHIHSVELISLSRLCEEKKHWGSYSPKTTTTTCFWLSHQMSARSAMLSASVYTMGLEWVRCYKVIFIRGSIGVYQYVTSLKINPGIVGCMLVIMCKYEICGIINKPVNSITNTVGSWEWVRQPVLSHDTSCWIRSDWVKCHQVNLIMLIHV